MIGLKGIFEYYVSNAAVASGCSWSAGWPGTSDRFWGKFVKLTLPLVIILLRKVLRNFMIFYRLTSIVRTAKSRRLRGAGHVARLLETAVNRSAVCCVYLRVFQNLFRNTVSYKCVQFLLSAFAKLRKATVSFVMSVLQHGTNRLALDGFWLNLIFELFSKICRENSSFIKILQK